MKIVKETDIFILEHLASSDREDIEKFHISNPKGKGLENYLKILALNEEIAGESRTYLVRDSQTKEIAAYFTLKAGLITSQTSIFSLSNLTGIDLSNFAVNDNYRKYKDIMPHIGAYVFSQFIIPCALNAQKIIGASYLYIFALPEERLMRHYNTLGFTRVENKKLERFIHRHIKPTYDKGCIFMYQRLLDSMK